VQQMPGRDVYLDGLLAIENLHYLRGSRSLCRRRPRGTVLTSRAAVCSNCSWVKGFVSIGIGRNFRARPDARSRSRRRKGYCGASTPPRSRPQARRADCRQGARHQMNHRRQLPGAPSSTIKNRFPLSGSGGSPAVCCGDRGQPASRGNCAFLTRPCRQR
jgi:hypothetical protein